VDDLIPLCKRRGIETTDNIRCIMLVKASVSETAQALVSIAKCDIWIQDCLRENIPRVEASFMVYRFAGHLWSTVEDYGGSSKMSVIPELAKNLSTELSTRVFLYNRADSSDYIEYQIYDNGFLSEHLLDDPDFGKDEPIPQSYEELLARREAEEEYDDDDYEDNEPPGACYPTLFNSTTRPMTPEEVYNSYAFTNQVFIDNDAYIPAILRNEAYIPAILQNDPSLPTGLILMLETYLGTQNVSLTSEHVERVDLVSSSEFLF
jgi:hypothetical protein